MISPISRQLLKEFTVPGALLMRVYVLIRVSDVNSENGREAQSDVRHGKFDC